MPSIAYLDFKYERTSTVNKIYDNAITLTALVDDCQIGFYASYGSYINLSISYDNGMTWTDIYLPSESNFYYPDPIDTGQTIMITGRENHHNYGCKGLHIFSEEDNYFNVSGNLTSLLDSDIALVEREWPQVKSYMDNCFDNLFGTFTNSNTTYRAYIKDVSGLIFPNLDPTQYMYARMFRGCTSLETAPVTLTTHVNSSSSCYGMFWGCPSLTTAPKLPATTLGFSCYADMFRECTSLTVAPELPATTLTMYCYQEMFQGCTSLVVAPRLPATTLTNACYQSMFEGCTSLTTAPELPATTLNGRCYRYMFKGCTSLTTAPVLPATSLVSECYTYMFEDCENLNYIKILATSWPANTYLEDHITDWVANVATTGTFVKDINTTYEIDSDSGVPIGWTVYNVGEEIPQIYTIDITIDPVGAGTVTGTGNYQDGSIISITATPDTGYIFGAWYNIHGELLSNNTTYTFTVTRNENFLAQFYEAQTTYYSIFVQQNVDAGTAPTGGGTYTEGSSCTITAYNHQDYTFVGWSLNDTIVSTNLSYTFTVDNTYTFIALYEYTPPAVLYTVTLYSNDDTMGYCNGAGTYTQGTSVTIQAVPNSGYRFVRWKDENGFEYSTNSTITLTITENIVLFADFEETDTYTHQYFTIQAIDDYLQVVLSAQNYYNSSRSNFNLWYQKNNDPWQKITFDYSQNDPYTGWSNARTICTLRSNETVKIHTDAHTLNSSTVSFLSLFSIFNQAEPNPGSKTANEYQYNARFNVYGNILSLIDYPSATNDGPNYGNPDYPTFSGITLLTNVFKSLFETMQVVSANNLRIPNIVSSAAFESAFYACKYLTTAPQLPATTLAPWCYNQMFAYCTSLTTAPQLPATTLANNCYGFMFDGCYNLIYYPELPATTLVYNCYQCMFLYCTSLTTAPELPATTLANNCYQFMFEGCTSLATAPELPATTLTYACYEAMFKGCTSLTTAPQLPATTLEGSCYQEMFAYCSSLNNIKCLATDISANNCTYNWLYGVSETGTFTKDPNATWSTGQDGIPTSWTVVDAS